jgi:hypothetical protein
MVAADAAALHAMSYPAVVVRHDMIDGIRALQLAFGAAPMAICHLCADTLFAGELDTVDCVSGNNMIHLKCAMVSFAADPSLFNVACPCGETEEALNGARPVCGGFSGALVDKAAQAAHEARMNALVEARTVMDPARFEGLPTAEEEVIAITILGLESVTVQETGEREGEWLKWLQDRTSAEQVLFKVKPADTQGQAGTLCVFWPIATTTLETEKYMREVEGLIMSQTAPYGDSRVPDRSPVIRSQDGEGYTTWRS